jgi:UDP-N-acetylmuramate dehydrogenase
MNKPCFQMDAGVKDGLSGRVKGRVLFDEPMAERTWLRVGGPADAYVEPADPEDLAGLVQWLAATGVPYLVIGGGSNLLVRDAGIRGVVIDMTAGIRGIAVTEADGAGARVRAMAGETLSRLCRFAVEKGLAGLGFAVGIPGSVGGAVYMNAGAAGRAMADVVAGAELLSPDGAVRTLSGPELAFEYRGSMLARRGGVPNPDIVLSADFDLEAGEPEALRRDADLSLRQRKSRQPHAAGMAGSFFRNPEDAPPAGRLIEAAGLKGFRIGAAEVSARHANFIVNRGGATAAEVLAVMDAVRRSVFERFQIELEPEVRIVGEKESA